jgi:hypothetical protein
VYDTTPVYETKLCEAFSDIEHRIATAMYSVTKYDNKYQGKVNKVLTE